MRIHYWSSASGNTHALAQKLIIPTFRIGDRPLTDYTVLMVPTYEQPRLDSYVPRQVREWVESNGQWVIGIIGTGNLNFGEDYCRAAHSLSDTLNVPVLHRCELRGTATDVEKIDCGIARYWATLVRMKRGL